MVSQLSAAGRWKSLERSRLDRGPFYAHADGRRTGRVRAHPLIKGMHRRQIGSAPPDSRQNAFIAEQSKSETASETLAPRRTPSSRGRAPRGAQPGRAGYVATRRHPRCDVGALQQLARFAADPGPACNAPPRIPEEPVQTQQHLAHANHCRVASYCLTS
jgi:hypothetical protein